MRDEVKDSKTRSPQNVLECIVSYPKRRITQRPVGGRWAAGGVLCIPKLSRSAAQSLIMQIQVYS